MCRHQKDARRSFHFGPCSGIWLTAYIWAGRSFIAFNRNTNSVWKLRESLDFSLLWSLVLFFIYTAIFFYHLNSTGLLTTVFSVVCQIVKNIFFSLHRDFNILFIFIDSNMRWWGTPQRPDWALSDRLFMLLNNQSTRNTFLQDEKSTPQDFNTANYNHNNALMAVHPTIFFCLSGVEIGQGNPDFHLPSQFIQFFQGNPKLFPGQPGGPILVLWR